MIVNLLGTNFAGKSTLISRGLSGVEHRFLDIARHRDLIYPAFYARHPEAIGPVSAQFFLLLRRPVAVFTFLRLFASRRRYLAERFWRYLFIQDRLTHAAEGSVPVIFDEGLAKKFIEAVPFPRNPDAPAARAEWAALMDAHAEGIVSATRGLADILIFVDADPDDIVRRAVARNPEFLQKGGEEGLRNRHEIQRAAFASVIDAASRAGIRTLSINTSQPGAEERFRAVFREKE